MNQQAAAISSGNKRQLFSHTTWYAAKLFPALFLLMLFLWLFPVAETGLREALCSGHVSPGREAGHDAALPIH